METVIPMFFLHLCDCKVYFDFFPLSHRSCKKPETLIGFLFSFSGTEFKLSEDLLKRDTKDSIRANLELELEIQNKITAAAHKLVNDPRAPKSVRKQRKGSYQQSLKRLQELEAKVNNLKHQQQQQKRIKQPRSELTSGNMVGGHVTTQHQTRLISAKRGMSVPEDLDHNEENMDDHSKAEEAAADDEVDKAMSPARSCPSSPRKNLNNQDNMSSLQNSPQRRGYVPSSVYTKSTYRSKQFPTFAAHNSPNAVTGIDANVGLPLSPPVAKTASPYRNKYEVPNLQLDSPVGLYNCPQQRTSQAFSSMDDLDAMTGATTSPLVRKNTANQIVMNHKYVLGQAREVMARVEAATAAVLSDNSKQNHHVMAMPNTATSGHSKLNRAAIEHPNLPPKMSSVESRSMENLESLETALHGRAKMHYREIKPETISHNLHNTEEYPPHHTHQSTRDSFPLPPSHRTTSTTLLPGQTYPEQPAKPITSLQDVFYHKVVEANKPSNSEKSTTESPPPPPLYPKKYHDVVEQRRRSGLDRPTAVAVPAVIQPIEAIKVPLESPAVDRRSKPKLDDSFEQQQTPPIVNDPQQQPNSAFKYMPYMETTKPFEMSDFYKYSTKYKKSTKNGSESSSTSTTSNDNNNSKPPELPAKNSPAKGAAPPPPPPPPKKTTTGNNVNNGDLGDTFSSEMLQWYKQRSNSNVAAVNKKKDSTTSDNEKPATLV